MAINNNNNPYESFRREPSSLPLARMFAFQTLVALPIFALGIGGCNYVFNQQNGGQVKQNEIKEIHKATDKLE